MALPTYQTKDVTLTLLQSNWATMLNPLLEMPLTQGQILEGVRLVNGANAIDHKLGRKLQGWWIVRLRASATVFDTQDSNPTPERNLRLTSSANVTVDLYVF
jgi:hypothetical protein